LKTEASSAPSRAAMSFWKSPISSRFWRRWSPQVERVAG
jgi:hypothetical protein